MSFLVEDLPEFSFWMADVSLSSFFLEGSPRPLSRELLPVAVAVTLTVTVNNNNDNGRSSGSDNDSDNDSAE